MKKESSSSEKKKQKKKIRLVLHFFTTFNTRRQWSSVLRIPDKESMNQIYVLPRQAVIKDRHSQKQKTQGIQNTTINQLTKTT